MIKLENIHIEYSDVLLENEQICMYPSSLTLVKGRSGTGKSTLLYRLGLIHPVIDYDYYIDGKNIKKAQESEIVSIRKNQIAFVLQDSLLFDHYNVLENLKHACMINEVSKSEEELLELLQEVRLDIRLDQRISQISGGERQRLSIACALCKEPQILILDEPTSALDIENERVVFEVLKHLAFTRHIYVIATSHSYHAYEYADHIYEIKDKHLIETKEYKNDEVIIWKQNQPPTEQFFHDYIEHFRKSYRLMYRLIIGVLAVTVILTCGIYQVVETKIHENKLLLDRISFNQLVITVNKDKIYLDDYVFGDYGKDMDLYDELQSMEEIKNVYPLYSYQANIYGIDLFILPIYRENNFQQQCSQIYQHRTNNHKVLLKASLYSSLVGLLENEKQIRLELLNNEEIYNIMGLLRQNYNTPYLSHSNTYLYLEHELIESIAQTVDLKPIGYSVFCKDLNALEKAEEKLLDKGYGVNDSFQKGKELREIQMNLEKTRNRLIGIVGSIALCFLIVLFSHYMNLRKKEFALLKVNGLGERDILHIIKKELIFFNIRGCIIPFCITLIILLVINKLSLGMMKMMVLLQAVQGTISYLMNKKYIAQISPEAILRN